MPLIRLSNSPSPSLHAVSLNHHCENFKTQQQIKPLNSPSLFHSLVQVGNMQHAQKLFDEMPSRSQASWTVLMDGYIRHGHAVQSLSLLTNMITELSLIDLLPDPFVVSVGLKACAIIGMLRFGRELHCFAVKSGYMEDLFVANALVNMYSACGLISHSEIVFKRILKPDLVSWSSMLNGFAKNGHEDEASRLFIEMARCGVQFDCHILSIGFKVGFGVHMHCYMIKMGLDSLFLCNSLMEFYGSIDELGSMRKVFDMMSKKDLVSWNTVISCHARNLCSEEALMFFSAMMHESSSKCDDFTLGSILHGVARLRSRNYGKEIHGYVIRAGFSSNCYVISALLDMYIKCNDRDTILLKLFIHFQSMGAELDEFIVASILKSCSLNQDLEAGKMFHASIIKFGMDLDPFVISSLIDMYSKCKSYDSSLRIFTKIKNPSTVPWSAIIAAHCSNGEFKEALHFFQEMQSNGIKPNEFTYTSVILAYIALGDLQCGMEIHCSAIRRGYSFNSSVINALISLYLEFGQFDEALKLSSSLNEDEIYWNSLIEAFGKAERHEEILRLFHKVQQIYGHLSHKSACFILNSCGCLVLPNAGTQAHAYIFKRGLSTSPNTANSLINMYSKCGTLDHAVDAFDQLHDKNSESWTSMISAHVYHGRPSKALSQFIEMIGKGKSPNANTFLHVLKACGEMGLVDEAFRVFTSMIEVYKINPSMEIYSSMVEVLSRAGMYKEAEHFIESFIPFQPGASIGRTPLSSFQNHGNMRIAKLASERLGELDSSDCTRNVQSELCWIETRGNVAEFGSGQRVIEQVSTKLKEVGKKMEEFGYVNDKCDWLHDFDKYEEKGYKHTELMALAYGFVSLPPGVPIRVFKVTRMCGYCHSACEFISTFVNREIVIKDSCRFHYFKDGKCSCKGKW